MTFKKLTLAASAAALALAPVGVQAANADRAAAPVSAEQELGGGSDAILAALAALALGAFIFFAADDDNPLST